MLKFQSVYSQLADLEQEFLADTQQEFTDSDADIIIALEQERELIQLRKQQCYN